jgi:hypothetical protein
MIMENAMLDTRKTTAQPDPLWAEANSIAYRVGLQGGFPNLVYRMLKMEESFAALRTELNDMVAKFARLENKS